MHNSTAIGINNNESNKHYIQQQKPSTKDIFYESICTKFKKKKN